MRTKNQFSIDHQQTLFALDLTAIEKERNKKIYLYKRLVYDRLRKIIIDELEGDKQIKLLKELESILMMKNEISEVSAIQKIIKIKDIPEQKEVSLSDEELLRLVAKRYKEDEKFLNKLSNILTF